MEFFIPQGLTCFWSQPQDAIQGTAYFRSASGSRFPIKHKKYFYSFRKKKREEMAQNGQKEWMSSLIIFWCLTTVHRKLCAANTVFFKVEARTVLQNKKTAFLIPLKILKPSCYLICDNWSDKDITEQKKTKLSVCKSLINILSLFFPINYTSSLISQPRGTWDTVLFLVNPTLLALFFLLLTLHIFFSFTFLLSSSFHDDPSD